MARLILATAEGQQAIELRPINSLGRHPNNTIQLLDKIVSKEHCILEQRDGSFILRDLGSLNGTYVNGERVRGETLLQARRRDRPRLDPRPLRRRLRRRPAAPAGRPRRRAAPARSTRRRRLAVAAAADASRHAAASAHAPPGTPIRTARSARRAQCPARCSSRASAAPRRRRSPSSPIVRPASAAPASTSSTPRAPSARRSPPRPRASCPSTQVGPRPGAAARRLRAPAHHLGAHARHRPRARPRPAARQDPPRPLQVHQGRPRRHPPARGRRHAAPARRPPPRRQRGAHPGQLDHPEPRHQGARGRTHARRVDGLRRVQGQIDDPEPDLERHGRARCCTRARRRCSACSGSTASRSPSSSRRTSSSSRRSPGRRRCSSRTPSSRRRSSRRSSCATASSRLVAPNVAEQMISGKLEVKKGGQLVQELTIFNSDIRGFTSMSEGTPAEVIVEMLNEYFELMVETLFKYEGTLDKFMGDGIMAFWGAPLAHPDDAIRSVQCAHRADGGARPLQPAAHRRQQAAAGGRHRHPHGARASSGTSAARRRSRTPSSATPRTPAPGSARRRWPGRSW